MVDKKVLADLKLAIEEIQQPRSNFQLEKFVVNQHPTKEMQYYQILSELQSLMFTYEDARLATEIQKIKIKRLRDSGDEIDSLEAKRLELGVEQTRIVALGAEREIEKLLELWQTYPKFTRLEIEQAQPEYWKDRLFRNAEAMLIGGANVNPSHIESMMQADILTEFVKQVEEGKNAVRNLES